MFAFVFATLALNLFIVFRIAHCIFPLDDRRPARRTDIHKIEKHVGIVHYQLRLDYCF